jgi:tetratricopeptide (TPR) repeat protein
MVREGLEAAPQDPELRSRLALYLAKRGDGAAARSELERLATRADLDAATLYRAAVAREVVGDRAAALELLRRALAAGYSLTEIRSDPETEVLRADPRFHRMVIPFAGESG